MWSATHFCQRVVEPVISLLNFPMIDRKHFVSGALFIIAAELMFATMGALVKSVTQDLTAELAVFMRSLFGLLMILPLVHRFGGLNGLKTQHPYAHVMRALAGVSAMYCFFYALAHLPLADGMLLKMTAPIFMPIVAWLWLSERATRLAILAVPVGFLGVLLILNPQGEVHPASLIGLLGGFLAALAKVTVRRLTLTEPTVRIVFYFSVLAVLVSALPLTWAWQTPSGLQWLQLGLMGMVGTAGQLFMTRGYASGPAPQLGPFTYFSVLFGAIYGYLFWDETLGWMFVLGAILIGIAGIFAAFRKRGVTNPSSSKPRRLRLL